MKKFNLVKNQFENFTNYIMERVLSCSVVLRSNFWQYLMLVSISSSLEFCVYEYFDVEFLFLFGETSPNSF